MRYLLTLIVYIVTLAVVAVAAFFAVIFLVGPHGGALPRSMEGVVLIVGWALVLALPFLAAWATWRRLGPR